jgi:hypothetical protein
MGRGDSLTFKSIAGKSVIFSGKNATFEETEPGLERFSGRARGIRPANFCGDPGSAALRVGPMTSGRAPGHGVAERNRDRRRTSSGLAIERFSVRVEMPTVGA